MEDCDMSSYFREDEPPTKPSHRKIPTSTRGGTRAALVVEVSFTSESHFFTGLSGDLSTGGIFVTTYENFEIGSELELEFALPEANIVAHGTVRWTRPAFETVAPGVGIVLDQLPPSDCAVIERFCAKRPPLYYDVVDSA